ncbi:Para-hydroxybenzoate--polyprenyltransferase, mitochondrial precursor (PHB:polyprenyltransferase) [Bonamia ostreae]|uniref:Para-hydroxybenzoate--polyprenyltransferase, mitochondrial (PHB:polyprenyltransferase) n=1 Tax=Bonamia ostreae TaxID=126728 RepID=A0ABV2AS95_9EUKA
MLKSRLKNCFLRAKPYLSVVRANNQIGTYLLFFPCAWSTAFGASNGCFPDLKILTLFLSGSFVMRNAGCIVNDLIDVDLDAKVDRTKNRPLSSGLLTKSKAIYFLISQLLIGLMVLAQFNTKT